MNYVYYTWLFVACVLGIVLKLEGAYAGPAPLIKNKPRKAVIPKLAPVPYLVDKGEAHHSQQTKLSNDPILTNEVLPIGTNQIDISNSLAVSFLTNKENPISTHQIESPAFHTLPLPVNAKEVGGAILPYPQKTVIPDSVTVPFQPVKVTPKNTHTHEILDSVTTPFYPYLVTPKDMHKKVIPESVTKPFHPYVVTPKYTHNNCDPIVCRFASSSVVRPVILVS